jgi:hypothetical protein
MFDGGNAMRFDGNGRVPGEDDSFDDAVNGYNGMVTPVRITDISCEREPAVVLGEIQYDDVVIRAEGIGFIVVEKAPAK